MIAEIGINIEKASELLQNGKIVAIPTETVYGLAANAFDEIAVAKIFEAKNRPSFDPLIVHIGNIEQIQNIANPSDFEIEFVQKFWPGPLTIILEKHKNIPFIVTSGLDTVGVRIPDHPLTLKLLKISNLPLAAPSANPFGYVSPTNANHVSNQLGEKIDYILDGGHSQVGVESTIVKVEKNGFHVLRLGGLSIEEIENKSSLKCLSIQTSSSKPSAPGMLESHYSPTPKVILYNPDDLNFVPSIAKFGAIVFGEKPSWIKSEKIEILSINKDLKEAAANLFASLRNLDLIELDCIYAPIVPDYGLGKAINDRFKRASC